METQDFEEPYLGDWQVIEMRDERPYKNYQSVEHLTNKRKNS